MKGGRIRDGSEGEEVGVGMLNYTSIIEAIRNQMAKLFLPSNNKFKFVLDIH